MLWANYFELITQADLLLFRYSLEILPDHAGRTPTGKKVKRIIELLIEDHFSQHAGSIATDYKSNMICRFDLSIDPNEYLVHYRSEGEDEPSANANTYRIRIQETGTLRVSELMDYLTSTHASALFGSKEELIQALNIAMGHYPKAATNIVSVGANKHFEAAAAGSETMDLGAGLNAIRGFFVSVRAATARILINVQVKSAAFYQTGELRRLVAAWTNVHRDDIRSMLRLSNFLKGVRIQVTHIERRNKAGDVILRIKTITGLAIPGEGQAPHRPQIEKAGAGPKGVKFYIGASDEPESSGAKGGGKKGGKKPIREGPKAAQDDYISVYDFFRTRKLVPIPFALGIAGS
jgi:eukaryotic translation initiation factor 2C